ncbi:dephospho-CoA kinase [Candidatus Neptunochlamydia vexilliferae]|uniref:Dephospho-CoA kinase n=1 Tax=Candidatus Neptunichlamydia vexilliferae TaxID=1651774 RepID=A0ABS0AXN9_9BACT|nr:dephospho-CoA kinase [Candidatus Neptunochlamydia vexilliferae]MBF5058740.1 Dephospho-CoA kinase [Candidatus Neptunochlamydia vexilliferae]
MKKIVITGGIASGKTTVCHILKKHGAYYLSSDEIIHRLLREDPPTIQAVTTLLGPDALKDGKIDRKEVAEIVFNDPKKLEALEKILHPKLLAKIKEAYQQAGECELFIVELPLVQEIGKEKDFDLTIAVVFDEAEAMKRFVKEGFTEESYKKRMARQWKISEKANKADYVIHNDGTIEELGIKVLELIKEISSR